MNYGLINHVGGQAITHTGEVPTKLSNYPAITWLIMLFLGQSIDLFLR